MHENQILDIGLKIFKERNKLHCRSYLYQKIREECCHNKPMLLYNNNNLFLRSRPSQHTKFGV
jgi:hypothetical protein